MKVLLEPVALDTQLTMTVMVVVEAMVKVADAAGMKASQLHYIGIAEASPLLIAKSFCLHQLVETS